MSSNLSHAPQDPPTREDVVTGHHEDGDQVLFLAAPYGGMPLFADGERQILGRRVQQLPPRRGERRQFHIHPLPGSQERVVVYDNDIPGLTPDEPRLFHPAAGVFASVGRHSLRIIRSKAGSSTVWATIVVLENDPALPIVLEFPDEADLAADTDLET